MEYSADIKTVKKWEEELNCRLEKEIKNNKVVSIVYIVCKKHEDRHYITEIIFLQMSTKFSINWKLSG